jgi:hypothetical protein
VARSRGSEAVSAGDDGSFALPTVYNTQLGALIPGWQNLIAGWQQPANGRGPGHSIGRR